MTTAAKAEIVKLAPNVAETIRVKYADIVEGQYGTQIRLKGESPDRRAISIYVPIDCSGALIQAGATEGKNDKGEFFTLPRNAEWWTVEKKQGAGEKYGHVTLTPKGANAPLPAKVPAPSTIPIPDAPRNGTVPRAEAVPELVAIYDDTLRHIVRIVGAINSQKDPAVVFTGTDAAAMAATLFIARSKAL
jgi:hypothetical protein